MSTTVSILGHRVERREDPPLLRGEGGFLADLVVPGLLHLAFVRSPLAHGVITSVDTAEAAAAPGVVAVFTAKDLQLNDLPEWAPPRPERPPRPELARPCLARDRVRFVGEAIAAVVAETEAQAVDAAEQVVVEIEPLPVVIDPLEALESSAPLLFPDLGTNVVLAAGSREGADALAGAEVVVRATFRNQRVAAAPMEPLGAVARPHPGGQLECMVSCQAPFQVRAGVARALGKEESEIWVHLPSVGGGFGAKGGCYPEVVVTAAVAERLGRPVRFVETRSENLVAMTHGRGQVQEIALGSLRDGTIVGLEARTVTEIGAYCWRGGVPWRTARLMATGVYRIPKVAIESLGVVTNTTPVGPYRGAGRPEATAMLERAIELLAEELGMDSIELRRRNLLRPEDFPYETPTGASYDSGEYERSLDAVLEHAGLEELRKEQRSRRETGALRQLGIGIATFVEVSGSGSEYSSLEVEPGGTILVRTGASPHGQGHLTTFTQLVSSTLSVPPDQVRIVHSDTNEVPRGTGTFGSRTGQLAGSAIFRSAEAVLAKARQQAAELLEASLEDVVVGEGGFAVAGVPSRTLSWAEVASAAGPGALSAEDDFAQEKGTYPFGTHLAVVELDCETGRIEILRFVAVDDCGAVLNPMIVEGQVHGGLAQGIAQALFEEIRYDELGNPLTANLADYEMPSAAEMPSFELEETVTPSPRNPLGMKGIGESGSVGSTAAVWNAVLDALRPYGVRHLDMPLTPEKIWRAIR